MPVRPCHLLQELHQHLRRTPRTGWSDHAVLFPEVISAHQARTAQIAEHVAPLFLTPQQARRTTEIMRNHDITESLVPDITPHMGLKKEEKAALEQKAIDAIGLIPHRGPQLRACFMEFEEGLTPAAVLGHAIDTFQMVQEALGIERTNRCVYTLQPFWDYAAQRLAKSPLMDFFVAMEAKRPAGAKDKPVLVRQPLPVDKLVELKRKTEKRIKAFALRLS